MNAGKPNERFLHNENPPNFLAESLVDLRTRLASQTPRSMAELTGTVLKENSSDYRFEFNLWNEPVSLSGTDWFARQENGKELHLGLQALILHYFTEADGTPLANQWVSYGDLPGGRIYAYAFQGYAGDKLTKYFGDDLNRLDTACEKAGGEIISNVDAVYIFQPLPRVPIRVNYWAGDEEFPATARILFDPTACHYLPIDVCAILGSMLVGRIIKAAGN